MPAAASWAGTPSIKGSSESIRMALLTTSLIGLQFTWGIEMTYCTPYLLQLGLTKSKTSLVWIAGPLSGLIMQPVIGVLADNSKSQWGRRRPFMLGGALIVALCLFILGWTAEIVSMLISDQHQAKNYTIALAVLSIYAVDFAINAVQSSCRSLIVDTLPISQQQLGSAWASRMIAIGHLLGYAVGTIDLVGVFGPMLGDSQFKQLCLISAIIFLVSVGITCWAVHERILISAREEDAHSGAFRMLVRILKTTTNLPGRIQAICWIQFWAWIGWFPFLFYSATWVGEVYFRYHPDPSTRTSKDALGDVGRIGSLSLVVFSIVTFFGSIALPWVIVSPEAAMAARSFTPRPPPALRPLVALLEKCRPNLLSAWQASHLIFAGAMCLAPFVRSFQMATLIVSICGVPWALACWAPFAFMGIEINRLTQPSLPPPPSSSSMTNGSTWRRTQSSNSLYSKQNSRDASPNMLQMKTLDHDLDLEDQKETDPFLSTPIPPKRSTSTSAAPSTPHNTRVVPPRSSSSSPLSSLTTSQNSATGETAGIYLGILNLFTTLPQFVGTFISMIVFSILEPGKSPELHQDGTHEDIKSAAEKPNGIAVCLFIGALSAMGAAYATQRMKSMR